MRQGLRAPKGGATNGEWVSRGIISGDTKGKSLFAMKTRIIVPGETRTIVPGGAMSRNGSMGNPSFKTILTEELKGLTTWKPKGWCQYYGQLEEQFLLFH